MNNENILTSDQVKSILLSNKNLFSKYKVKKLGLIGSVARGTQTENSDVDIVVEFSEKSFDNFMDLAFNLEELLQRKVDLLTLESISPYMKQYIDKEVVWYEA